VKIGKILGLVLVLGLLVAVMTLGGCVPTEDDGGGTTNIIYLVVMLVLLAAMFYFLMIRPMRQREKKHDQMVDELQRGDMVVTAGGIHGQVERIDEDSLLIKVESGAIIRVTKGGVLTKREK